MIKRGVRLRLRRYYSLYEYPRLVRSQGERLIAEDTNLPRADIKKINQILKKKVTTKRSDAIEEITHSNNIITLEINDFLKKLNEEDGTNLQLKDIYNSKSVIKSFLPHTNNARVFTATVRDVSTDGYGLAITSKNYINQENFTILKIPKVCKGDVVQVLIKFHHEFYAECEVVEIIKSGGGRDDSLVKCQHFKTCSGCQFQMIPYKYQLRHKSKSIEKAYRYFYPELGLEYVKVVESLLQYNYRTKLTPHFFVNKGIINKIGFESVYKYLRGVDVIHCPIATEEVNKLYSELRPQIINKPPKQAQFTIKQSLENGNPTAVEGFKNIITEKVNDSIFQFSSSCFFQTNNSILSPLFKYLESQIDECNFELKNIVDTYCGVGLFGISLAKVKKDIKVFGIEISQEQIQFAEKNVKLNKLNPKHVQFISGDASNIFKNEKFNKMKIKGSGSLVIIDPSRKGSNKEFLQQLIEFEPDMIIYVSCNVFTQARDLAMFKHLQKQVNYKIKELIGFDFFPQTKHIETVAILENCK
ncbi:unnamed protein product [Candida verbasci]|uniref:TRAM domain-containing protein n=1 Tax=Candida verbasci TaxID=1227364 RepID=A0A9W4TQQ9_9ASCO|nr:unnamed protein product [Candida verbasci]